MQKIRFKAGSQPHQVGTSQFSAWRIPLVGTLKKPMKRHIAIPSSLTFDALQVPRVPPLPGLAPTRFMVGCKVLVGDKEKRCREILREIKRICFERRLCTQPFFEDFAHGKMSCNVVGHVTYAQFGAALNSEAGLRILPADLEILQEKYDDLNNGMCNYFAFSNEIDPFSPANSIKPEPAPPPVCPYPRVKSPPWHYPVPGDPGWKIDPSLLGGDKQPLMQGSPRPGSPNTRLDFEINSPKKAGWDK
jgi:hypothetical protein